MEEQQPVYLTKFNEYALLRRKHDELKKQAADVEKDRRRLEQELVDAMLEQKLKSFKMDGGMTVSLRRRFDCSVNKDNEEQVAAWLTKTVGDVRPFQKLVLYKPAVVQHLKDLAEKEQLDETAVPDFLNLKTTPGVTVRGWQGGSEEDE